MHTTAKSTTPCPASAIADTMIDLKTYLDRLERHEYAARKSPGDPLPGHERAEENGWVRYYDFENLIQSSPSTTHRGAVAQLLVALGTIAGQVENVGGLTDVADTTQITKSDLCAVRSDLQRAELAMRFAMHVLVDPAFGLDVLVEHYASPWMDPNNDPMAAEAEAGAKVAA